MAHNCSLSRLASDKVAARHLLLVHDARAGTRQQARAARGTRSPFDAASDLTLPRCDHAVKATAANCQGGTLREARRHRSLRSSLAALVSSWQTEYVLASVAQFAPIGESVARRLLRVKDVLDADYARSWNSAQLARIALLSPTHLRRTFRAAFGQSPHAYLSRRRIERACHLLRSTPLSVTQIAHDVAYASLGTFTRTFLGAVGETPTQYRGRGPSPAIPSCFIRQSGMARKVV